MKIVNKPWGYEEWLGEGRCVLKKIFMKAGYKSSLQYHEVKEEINYIISGRGVMLLGDTFLPLEAGVSFHILPPTVHRVWAYTDITMIETSTPEVDDVVRLEDDYDRGNGRIESEHE